MPSYATVSEFKDEVQITSHTTSDWIEALLDAAEQAINNICKRPDGFVADAVANARYYSGTGLPWQEIDECTSVSAVAVKDSPSDDEDSYTSWTVGTVGTTTDADVFPARGSGRNPQYGKTPYNLLVIGLNGAYSYFPSGRITTRRGFKPEYTGGVNLPTIKVTAKWGYATTVPYTIKQACIMQAARWYQRLKSSMADTTAGPEYGALLYRKVIDPDIELILVQGGYVKPTIGGAP